MTDPHTDRAGGPRQHVPAGLRSWSVPFPGYNPPEWTAQKVFDAAADEPDPTVIDWPARQGAATIPFVTVNRRPINPVERTGRVGRGGMYRWAENQMADVFVVAVTDDGRMFALLVERGDRLGWAMPGGGRGKGENWFDAAVREMREETGLRLPGANWRRSDPQYVPDPRASDEAWAVTIVLTTVVRVPAGQSVDQVFPVAGGDDAARAAWVPCDTVDGLRAALREDYGSDLWHAHQEIVARQLRGIVELLRGNG